MNILEQELEAILHASHDNIVVTDQHGIVLRVSQNCKDIYGYAVSELIGKSVYALQEEGIFLPSVTVAVLKSRKQVQLMQKTETGKVVMATGIPVFSNNEIVRVISFSHDLTELRRLQEDYEQLQAKMKKYELEIEELREQQAGDIVMRSHSMKKVWKLINRISSSDATVVMLGESGVGKTAFACAIHRQSNRKNEPFVEINCGAIPSSLFESEMFGYEAGAFTGASAKGKTGKFELANKGTLFLDEVAELPLEMQVKLLKVLQEKTITRIGSEHSKKIDFRLIVATNQNLEEKVKDGSFRADLFYRLNVIPIKIPPLRDRQEDILELAYHILQKYNDKYGTSKFFHKESVDMLLTYNWPGNVRELENMIERLVLTTEENTIYKYDFPFLATKEKALTEEWSSLQNLNARGITLQDALAEVEKSMLLRAYRQCQTTYEMAELLGLSQSTIVRRLKKYKIQ
ncbi:PAS domain S-box protein [Priestia megaterium]|nr:PAS domain S-box protein [Priestia megaterium]